jgi:hypothetical protein
VLGHGHLASRSTIEKPDPQIPEHFVVTAIAAENVGRWNRNAMS